MKNFYPLLLFIQLIGSINANSQIPIDVVESTIKVNGFGEEVLYYGFAEGDQIIFNFEVVKGKDLKELEIVEYPSNSKFADFKSKKIENKIIHVIKQSVFLFRFKNSAIGGKVCKLKIQRIPASDASKNFNPSVSWVTKQDTTWNTFTKDVVIGYDTLRLQKTKKELVSIDTIYVPLFDKVIRVHSLLGPSTQHSYATVELPKNTYEPNFFAPYKSSEVIAWSYWLGVGQKAKEEYEKANKNLATGIKIVGTLTGYGALATLLSTGVSLFGTPSVGNNVHYRFYGLQNGQEITIDYGNVVAASARNEKIRQGGFNIELYNDNVREGIDVTVKMLVMQVSKTWKDIPFTELNVTPRYEKQLFKEPIVSTRKLPVTGI
jgi:hypothetical protein